MYEKSWQDAVFISALDTCTFVRCWIWPVMIPFTLSGAFTLWMPLVFSSLAFGPYLDLPLSAQSHFGNLNGCASVFKTHSSKLTKLSSLNSK